MSHLADRVFAATMARRFFGGSLTPRGRAVGQLKEVEVIRDAMITDVSGIRALMSSVAGFWDETWRPDVLERAVGSPDTIALINLDRDVVDGFVCAHDLGFRAYLSEIVVSPQAQRRGIGSRLLSEVERRMADRGCSVIVSDVWRDAERFYRAKGWAPPSVILLRKRLPAAAAQPAVCSHE
jgi:ribosomal protein S18 acetylase RimI-like enzyme